MKRFKENVAYLGLSLWKEMFFFFVVSAFFVAAGVAIYFYKGLSIFLLFPVLGYLLFAVFFFTRYGAARRKKAEKMETEFVQIFTFFGVYITDGFTVYNALERVLPYGSETMKEWLEELLHAIDEDKSVAPYVAFAARFESISIKEVMLSVYEMVDEGEAGVYVRQFQRLFGKLSDTRHMLDKEKRLQKLDTLAFLPLCGSGLALLLLTVSLLEIMGGLMDVV